MKKLILLLTIAISALTIKAVDTNFVYQKNSVITIVGLETNPIYINPSSSSIRMYGNDFIIFDGILKHDYNIGSYDEIFNIDTISFASNSAAQDYLSMFIGCNESQFNFGFTGNLDTTGNSVYTVDKNGFNTMTFRIIPPGSGTVTFEASFDGVNYEAITFRSITDDVLASSASDTANFIGSIIGVISFRFRTSTVGTATLGTVTGSMSKQVAIIENVEFNAPPHRFGFLPVIKTVNLTDADTVTAWLPATGKRFAVTDLSVLAGGATDGTVKIYSGVDTVFNTLIDVSNQKNFIYPRTFRTPWLGISVNDSIRVSTSAGVDVNIVLQGYEY